MLPLPSNTNLDGAIAVCLVLGRCGLCLAVTKSDALLLAPCRVLLATGMLAQANTLSKM